MTLKTGRADTPANVSIDHHACTDCGLCVAVCKGAPLTLREGRVVVEPNRYFGCIGCGHCVAVCPEACITVTGRDFSSADVTEAPPASAKSGYESLHALFFGRRSTRCFKKKEVDRDLVDQILSSVATAPMGLPPSDVGILVLHGRPKVQEFAGDIVDLMRKSRRLCSPPMLPFIRLIQGKAAAEVMKGFVADLIDTVTEKRTAGEDWLFYDAPLALHFYVSPYADPADPVVSATYAMLSAEALGLGSCMIGAAGPFLAHGKAIMKKYGIPTESRQGITVIIGHPAVRFRRALKRRPATVQYY